MLCYETTLVVVWGVKGIGPISYLTPKCIYDFLQTHTLLYTITRKLPPIGYVLLPISS